MSLPYDHQHLNDILEAAHSAAFEFLESLSTRPAGRTPQPLPHDVLPEEGLGALSALSAFRAKYEALLSRMDGYYSRPPSSPENPPFAQPLSTGRRASRTSHLSSTLWNSARTS